MNSPIELAPETWDEYFGAVNRELLESQVSLEVAGGNRLAPVRMPLRALTYNERDDVLDVALSVGDVSKQVRHQVVHPVRVSIDTRTLLAPLTIEVDGRDGTRTVIRFERELDPADSRW